MKEFVNCVLKVNKIKNIINLLLFAFIVISCNKNKGTSGNIGNNKNEQKSEINSKPIAKVNFNIYIENSGSMDGYLTNQSDFKETLKGFASDIPTYFNNSFPDVYFVNSHNSCKQYLRKLTPEYSNFFTNLSLYKSRLQCSSGGNSSIDDIINIATLNSSDNINVIFSDCILSNKGTGTGGATSAQAHIKMFMSQKIRSQKLSTIVVKLKSQFRGSYYNESNRGKEITTNQTIHRPYYILIFGETAYLQHLLSKIDFRKYPGYESSFTLLAESKSTKLKSIITYKNRNGSSFDFKKPASLMEIYNAKEKEGTKEFQFSIDMNLNDFPFQKDFLMEKSNYSIDNDFEIVSIDSLHNSGSKYSHSITFKTNNLKQHSKLNFGIKYAIPTWVNDTGTDVDDNPQDTLQQKQTFGFQYLMKGLSEAYVANNNKLQFSIPITVDKNENNQSKSNFPWWIIAVLTVIVGLIIYNKNKK